MFSARRKPKRVARDDSDKDANNDSVEETSNSEESGPVVRRPTAAPKSKSKLRTSFAPDEAEEDNTSDAPSVVRPKQRPGGQKSTSNQALPRFNIDSSRTQDLDNALRPSYSKSALEELRNSIPSTPKDLSVYDPSSGTEDVTTISVNPGTSKQDLDLLSKFGSQSLKPASSIPSATEIAEKKARRARLAKEQDAYKTDENYIALDDDQLYDSDGEFKPRRMQVGTYLHTNDPTEKDTRMIRDDEDIMEGFDEYTEDAQSNRITMGRKQLLQAQRQDREAMRSMIDSAQGHHHHHHHHQTSEPDSDSNSNSSDSDERNHLYEKSQTNHGMDGLSSLKQSHRQQQSRPRQPRETTPIPKLASALDKLRERVAGIEISRVQIERRRAEIRRERAEVRESQEHIQKSLVEAGEELDKIRKKEEREQQQQQERDQGQEQGIERRGGGGGGGGGGVNGNEGGLRASGGVAVKRGLDSMGVTPEPA